MSNKAVSLVWERARAGLTDLLLLIKIADLCDDDGRNCWMETPAMARALRASDRGAVIILQRLEGDREIEIEWNDEGRFIELRGGRRFTPKWFIHVRCVCEWESYQQETASLEPQASPKFRRGRPRRKSAHPSDSRARRNPNSVPRNQNKEARKSENGDSAYKEVPLKDLSIDQKQAPPPTGAEKAGAPRRDRPRENPDDNVSVITKLAHEVLDLHGETPGITLGEIEGFVKERCATLSVAYRSDVVTRAIDSALYQRRRAGKFPLFQTAPGEAAFRLRSDDERRERHGESQ